MKSVFVRIWLSFWAVIVLTFLVALLISFAYAVQRAKQIDRLSPAVLAQDASRAMDQAGDDGLRQWLLQVHNEHPELDITVVDPSGRELRGRSRAEVARAFANSGSGTSFPAQYTIKRRDGSYRFAFRRLQSLSFDLWDLLLQPWVLLLLIVIFSGLGAAFLAYSLAAPILQLRMGIRAIAGGNLNATAGPHLTKRRDEVGSLAREFNHMGLRLRDLMNSKETLLQDVSHELRSPLARLRIASDLGRRGTETTGCATYFDPIDREVARLDELIDQILSFSRLDTTAVLNGSEISFLEVVKNALEDARFEASAQNKQIRFSVPRAPIIWGDRRLLHSAVLNGLRNAIHFSPDGGDVEVKLSVDGISSALKICNAADGIIDSELKQIFEPFYRGANSNGFGLGLCIVQRIMILHKGSVSAEVQGDSFCLTLTMPVLRQVEDHSECSAAGTA